MYQSKRLQRFISVWGLAAVGGIFAINLIGLFSEISLPVGMIFALPIILNEIFLVVWLIAKGFNPPAAAAE